MNEQPGAASPRENLGSPRAKRSARRRGCLVASGILTVFSTLFLGLFFSDAPLPDDGDLIPKRWDDVPDEENAAWYLREAQMSVDHNALVLFDDHWDTAVKEGLQSFLADREETLARLKELGIEEPLRTVLEVHRKTYDLLDRAARAPEFAPPWDLRWGASGGIGMGLRMLPELAAFEAWLGGDSDRAWEILLGERKILRASSERPGGNSDIYTLLLEQVALPGPGLSRLELALAPGCTPDQLRRWLDDLADPLLSDDWLARMFEREYQIVKMILADEDEMVPFFEIPTRLLYRRGRTLRRVAMIYRTRIAAARLEEDDPADHEEAGWFDHVQWLLGGNYNGDALIDQSLGSGSVVPAVRQMGAEAEVIDTLTRAVLALRLYQLEHGDWPDSLEALVPGILPDLPRDPFDPNVGPLRYSKESRTLWSIGHDGVDEGGTADETVLEFSGWAREPTIALEAGVIGVQKSGKDR